MGVDFGPEHGAAGAQGLKALGGPRLRDRRSARRSVAVADARGIGETRPTRAIAARESVSRRLLASADVLGSTAALLLAVPVLGDDVLRAPTLLALPLVVLVAKLQGLYDRDALLLNKTTLEEVPKLFQAATLYTLLLILAQDAFISGMLGIEQAVALWLTLFVATVWGRWLARRAAARIVGPERVLVIGGPAETALVEGKLAAYPSINATVVGRIPLDLRAPADNGAVGTAADLKRVVAELGVHRALISPGNTPYDRTLESIRAAKAVGVQVSVLPRLLEVVGSSVEFDQLYGLSVLGIRRFGLTSSSQAIKRAMDEIGSAIGIVVLAPLFVALGVAVKLSSPGPVFFRQLRVGKDGRPFELIKFRTMFEGADQLQAEFEELNEAPDGLFKIADDPRVTPIGRFLRRTSFDELPQLINVLRGEMSLVGPRPLVPEEDERLEGRHRRLLHLKPGMTGQWQIYGSSKVPIREMVTIDYLYVANWSLWNDLKILCRTVEHIVARRGV